MPDAFVLARRAAPVRGRQFLGFARRPEKKPVRTRTGNEMLNEIFRARRACARLAKTPPQTSRTA